MTQTLRIIIKLGTSVLTNNSPHLNRARMLEIVQQIGRLHDAGHEVIVVSSGAQAAGRDVLDVSRLAKTIQAKQMLCAVGQIRLIRAYAELFDIFSITVAQVLLTRGDLNDRLRYLNSRETLLALVENRIIPIINENDTTATEEIRVGDNDNLSALVANLLDADLLLLLTDQPGLFTADPRTHTDAQLIAVVHHIDETTRAIAGGAGTHQGTGGMATKIEAAQLASRSGVTTVIAAGREPDVISRIVAGESVGTRFEPTVAQLEGRKRWMLAEKPHGTLAVDAGAARKLRTGGVSLLPVGVTAVEGVFTRGALLTVQAPDGEPIAHGLTNYSSDDLQRLCGAQSNRIVEILGYTYGDAAIHRNNLVLLK